MNVRLGTEATGRAVSTVAPEVCILATGAGVVVDAVAQGAPGNVAVWRGDDVAKPPAGQRVVVLGVDRSALVAAETLAKQGREVTMLAGARKQAFNVAPTFKWRHAAWVKEFDIKVLRGASAAGWDDSGRLLLQWNPDDEKTRDAERPDRLEVDLLVAAGERASRQKLVSELEYRVDVLHVVGDAVSPQTCCQAIHTAYRTAVHV